MMILSPQPPAYLRCAVVLGLAGVVVSAHGVGAQEPAPDFPSLIECRSGAAEWGEVAFALMGDPAIIDIWGWPALPSINPFLQEYELSDPIQVFARRADRLAFTATGPVAVLSDVDPAALAAEVGASVVQASPQFRAEKVVADTIESGTGGKFRTRIALSVVTVDTHPGATLVGCSYVIEPFDA